MTIFCARALAAGISVGVLSASFVAFSAALAAPLGKGREVYREPLANWMTVKFTDGSAVRARDGLLEGRGAARAARILAGQPGARVGLEFGLDRGTLRAWHRLAETAREERIPDPALFFRVHLPAGDAPRIARLLEELDEVEIAYPQGAAAPDPACTAPDYQGSQGYLGPAPGGIDAYFSWTFPGGNGTGMKVVDIERAWTQPHEDLSRSWGQLYGATPQPTPGDHGCAVLGEMIGDPNGCGVLGAAHGATANMVSHQYPWGTTNVARAIAYACSITQPGDVILLEVQLGGPSCGGTGLVPSSWDPAAYTAITIATALGRNVVEAAGNGTENLDCATYKVAGVPWFSVYHDSGAIMVGAGASPNSVGTYGTTVDRGVLNFSNFGSRVNLQGWGERVVTTGYGDLFGASPPVYYTATFSGTSSASPIVASAVLDLEGAYRAATGSVLTPAQVRQILMATGSPQMFGTGAPSSKHIGPRPDLKTALQSLLLTPGMSFTMTSTPTITATGSFSPSMTASFTRCATGSTTASRTATSTGSFSPSLTLTLCFTPTRTATACGSSAYSCTPTSSRTPSRTWTISNTPSISSTATTSSTPTRSITATPTETATPQPQFAIWPNPAPAGATIRFDGLGPDVAVVEIFTVSGERIARFETDEGFLLWTPITGDGRLFSAGPYVCRVGRSGAWLARTFAIGRGPF